MFLTRCLGNLQQKTRFLFVRRNSTIQDQPGSKLLTKLFLCLNLTRPQAHCFDNTTLKTECSVLTNHQNKIKRYPTLLPGTAVVTLCVTAAKMNRVWQQSLVCSPNVLPLAWISQSQSDKSPSCLPLCFFVALFHTVMCMTSSPNQSETITPNSPFEWMPESHKQSHAIPILPRPFLNFFFFFYMWNQQEVFGHSRGWKNDSSPGDCLDLDFEWRREKNIEGQESNMGGTFKMQNSD